MLNNEIILFCRSIGFSPRKCKYHMFKTEKRANKLPHSSEQAIELSLGCSHHGKSIMLLGVDVSRRLSICSFFQLQKDKHCWKGKNPPKHWTPVAVPETPAAIEVPGPAYVHRPLSGVSSTCFLKGVSQRSAGIWISCSSSGGDPLWTFMGCVMHFRGEVQPWGVSITHSFPVFSKLFHLQLAATHTWARGQEKHCSGFMLLQLAFLLLVNPKTSQSRLVRMGEEQWWVSPFSFLMSLG